ncbi:hypothetical protein BKA93DRAFT_807745 [Sparassis latifolia]
MAAIQSQKKVLAKTMRTMLRSLSSSDIQQQSQVITERVLASPFFQTSQTISCYLSMPSGEVDTSALVSGILRAGKTLFVPKTDATQEGKMDFLRVHSEDDLRDFPPGIWGINEPGFEYFKKRRQNALDEASDPLDLILLPGLAFDRSLSRLGYGKGYYDRYISAYTATTNMRRKPLLVALALREQILVAERVPTALHDWKMDVIVGPDGFIRREDGPA